jgi:hypothetical protein
VKIAIQISGQPRFTREFDDYLTKIQDYDQLDFYFYLWNHTNKNHALISSNWPSNLDDIRALMEKNLPKNSNIIELKVVKPPAYTVPSYVQSNPWTNPLNVWYHYYSFKQVSLLRENYEQLNGKYDMVAKARGDAGIKQTISLRQCYSVIQQNPKIIIVPDTHRHGIGYSINDMIAWGSSEAMSIYSRAIDHFEEYHKQGLYYHAETLLGHHLTINGFVWPTFGIEEIKNEYQDPVAIPDPKFVDYGKWG